MIQREIAVVVSYANKNVSVIDTIDAIQNAGFKNVFIQWDNREWNPTQEEQHLGYQNINNLWIDTEAGHDAFDRKSEVPKYNEKSCLIVC